MPARHPDDQIIIDDLFRKLNEQEKINDELRKENSSLRKDLEKLKKEFDDYKVRHPENVGIKNGKPYFYKPEAKSEQCDPAACRCPEEETRSGKGSQGIPQARAGSH